MSEPRRWWISDSTANRIEPLPSIKHLYVEVMAVEDHDRIVAELRSEVAQAKREAADAMSGCCDCPMFKAQGKTVARQARVIKKLKLAVTDIANKNTCWRLYEIDKYKSYEDGWEGVAEFAGKVLNELAAIEREGEGT